MKFVPTGETSSEPASLESSIIEIHGYLPKKVLPNNMGLKGPYFQYGLMVNTTNPLNNMGVSEKRGILPNSY